MAEAARRNVDAGAQIIDINMGCPAKKVCNKDAGSALLRDESHVAAILTATVDAVDVPVTLKIRTGWAPDQRNAVNIARIAEEAGIRALAVHGRTRACRFDGTVEYETIAAVKQAVRIPVFANGDIDSPAKAVAVLQATGADGIMIGRAAQGRPWIFSRDRRLVARDGAAPPAIPEVRDIMLTHLRDLYEFYGAESGVRIARKHIGWYCSGRPQAQAFRQSVMQAVSAAAQFAQVQDYFDALEETGGRRGCLTFLQSRRGTTNGTRGGPPWRRAASKHRPGASPSRPAIRSTVTPCRCDRSPSRRSTAISRR